jgi:hypothetical protein
VKGKYTQLIFRVSSLLNESGEYAASIENKEITVRWVCGVHLKNRWDCAELNSITEYGNMVHHLL